MDISNGVTLENVLLEDILPAEIQWTGGPISINAPVSSGCQTTSLPNFAPTAGGTLIVECDSVTGSGNVEDLVVILPVYITDILDETIDDSQLIINTVNADYSYDGEDFSDSDISELVALHAAVQKKIRDAGGDAPGDIITYDISF